MCLSDDTRRDPSVLSQYVAHSTRGCPIYSPSCTSKYVAVVFQFGCVCNLNLYISVFTTAMFSLEPRKGLKILMVLLVMEQYVFKRFSVANNLYFFT